MFDPYRKWLGITTDTHPPNHYRLLGIEVFEDDADVIDNAFEQRMAHIRKFQAGSHADHANQLLNELTAARICLLNSESKLRYDESLRAKQIQAVQSLKPESVASGEQRWSIAVAIGIVVILIAIVILWRAETEDGLQQTTVDRNPQASSRDKPLSRAQFDKPPAKPSKGTETRVGQAKEVAAKSTPDAREPKVKEQEYSEEIDLLENLDVASATTKGKWILSGGRLRNHKPTTHGLLFQHVLPRRYEVVVVAARLSNKRSISLGLAFQGRPFTVIIDGRGTTSGLQPINGKRYDKNATTVNGAQLSRQPSTIRCRVDENEVVVYVREKEIIRWQGEPGQLPASFAPVKFGLGASGAVYAITELKIRY